MTSKETTVYWDALHYNEWTLHVAATDRGLCCITLPNDTFDTVRQWASKWTPKATLLPERARLERATEQVAEYLRGRRKSFSLPLDLRGTPFQLRVWQAMLDIPFGATRSYGEVAATIGHPRAVRAVGAASGANPVPLVVPCHRVIGKDGTLTGYGGGLKMKERLLLLEQEQPHFSFIE